MSRSADKSSSSSKSFLSVQVIVAIGIAWAVIALLFFLLFSTPTPNEKGELVRAGWYQSGTYLLEQGAWLAAASLCLRNARSSLIISGRNVWLAIGLGTLSYFLGNILLGIWELSLGLDPNVSPADIFFVSAYILISLGMVLAVTSRRLNLVSWQWAVVVLIGVVGAAIAWFVSKPAGTPPPEPAAIVQSAPTPTSQATPTPTPQATPAPVAVPQSPAWALALDKQLQPLAQPLALFYVIMDVVLLIIAAMLLLAFWGGRFSQSWRMIAAAAFSLYIADIWFKYAANTNPNYQTGDLLEVFWIFSAVLFAIGAALEHDVSLKASRRSRRRG
ncbi:hypothetical protein OOK60_14020 [Trichothermofontia sichuanensis B231]|uniref:hypothetical protein n=1 Tax=Trichothermofontia sichuanensis TaxID=3045816 RepID=UPI00224835BA|nr:hypothetical protein [Trichothermofontia sichuanensis]UZQ53605.1 hypothetical protein OOK60_14020 [Trichothermofontia sichuanensis B231]